MHFLLNSAKVNLVQCNIALKCRRHRHWYCCYCFTYSFVNPFESIWSGSLSPARFIDSHFSVCLLIRSVCILFKLYAWFVQYVFVLSACVVRLFGLNISFIDSMIVFSFFFLLLASNFNFIFYFIFRLHFFHRCFFFLRINLLGYSSCIWL